MNPFRSVGALLSIALSIVIVGALLIVYFMVVPSLQHRLIDTRLKQLEGHASRLRADFQTTNVPGGFVRFRGRTRGCDCRDVELCDQ